MENKRLKELLKINPENMNKKQEKEFFNELINATLFLPVDFDEKANASKDKPLSFTPLIGKSDNQTFVPLFTDKESARKFGDFDFVKIQCEDVAAIIVQSGDINAVVLNPSSNYSIGMSADSFLDSLTKNKFAEIETLLENNAQVSTEETRFYLREDVPLMKKTAENGIFTSKLPFLVSFSDNAGDEKYLNILIVPRGVKFLFTGEDKNSFGDSILLPTIQFKLIKEEGNVFTWKCINQKLSNNKELDLKILLLSFTIVFIAVLVILFIF